MIQIPTPFAKVPRPRPETFEAMRKAAAMLAAGVTHAEVAKALKRRPTVIGYWKQKYLQQWRSIYDAAIQSALVMVRHFLSRLPPRWRPGGRQHRQREEGDRPLARPTRATRWVSPGDTFRVVLSAPPTPQFYQPGRPRPGRR